jgi:hypothetical protein
VDDERSDEDVYGRHAVQRGHVAKEFCKENEYRDTAPEAAVKQIQRGEDSCFSRLGYFCGKRKHKN